MRTSINPETIQNEVEQFMTDLGLNFRFTARCESNGISIYYKVKPIGGGDERKVRFSNHGISNPYRMATEICVNFYRLDEEKSVAALLCQLGSEEYTYGAVEYKTVQIEVPKLEEGQAAISERAAKSGRTIYTIEITKAARFGYFKKAA